MKNSNRTSSILFNLSIILSLFLVTCGFYFISFPTPEKLIGPVLEEDPTFEIDIVPQTVQPEAPPKPQPPSHDFGDIQIEDDIKDVDVMKPDVTILKDPLTNLPREIEDEPIAETTAVLSSLPQLIHKEQIIYPAIAVHNQIEGTVHVGFILSKTGVPQDLKIIKSSNPVLDDAALSTVEKYRYKPAYQMLIPVRLRMIIPVKFKLR